MEDVSRCGTVRDLSLGGCCIETAHPIECGTRAEFLIQVNTHSFRALGQVRATRERSAGVQFLQLTQFGQTVLQEILAEVAKLHLAVSALRGARRRQDPDLQLQLDREELEGLSLKEQFPLLRRMLAAPAPKPETSSSKDEGEEKPVLLSPSHDICVVSIDLFG